ncbi:MAG: hypothetical protein HDR44_00065 [Allobaculum sp.]|nr:hypothetical protein [Allobaculum sp.]
MKKEKLFLALLTGAIATPATLSIADSIIPVLAEEPSPTEEENATKTQVDKTDNGTLTFTFHNKTYDFDKNYIIQTEFTSPYTVTPVEPTSIEVKWNPKDKSPVTLKADTDYIIDWTNNTNVGNNAIAKFTFKGNYTSSQPISLNFSITQLDLSQSTNIKVNLEGGDTQSLNIDGVKPNVWIELREDRLPVDNYTIEFGANNKVGKGTVKITGKNNCTGFITKEFTIVEDKNSSSSSTSSTASNPSNNSTSSASSSSNNSSSTNSSTTSSSTTTTGSTNSKPTLTLPTDAIGIKVENNETLKSADVKKLEDYIKSNHNEYGYDLKVNSASVAIENGQSTFTMSITAQLENDSKIDITLSNLKKRRSEDAMIEENEFVEFIDLEEEMEDASLDYVTVDDPGNDGKKVTIKGIKASDAFRVNNYLNGTKIRNILSDHGYKVSDLNFSSAAKMNHEFSITDLSKPISIVASATPQSSSTTTTPSKPVGGNGIIQLPSSPAQPTTPTVVKKPTYRFFNTLTGEHFYTTSEAERDELMKDSRWNNEGQGWISPETSRIVVYRLCNPNTGEHHYTTDKNEYDTLPAYGWRQEGIGFYSADPQVSDIAVVYRLFNPKANNAGSHHYTLSEQERNNLVNNGWRDEGIAWYGIREDLPTNSDIPSQPDITPNTPTSENIDLKGYYVHSSGVGAWGTELTIDDNNHFIGKYEDSNIKEVFFCQYSGDIVDIQKVGDKKYIGRIANLQRELPSQAWLASFPSDVKVEEVDNPSFKNGDQVMIYLAGYPVNQVSEAEYSWMGIWGSLLTDKTPGIFITNLDNEWSGFCGYNLPTF